MMAALFLIPIYSFLFRLRGKTAARKITNPSEIADWMNELKDYSPKPLIFAYWTLLSFTLLYFTTDMGMYALLLFAAAHYAGSFLQYLPEFGKYFPFSPFNTSQEKGIKLVDRLADWSAGEYHIESSLAHGRVWRTHGFRWRWALLSAPKFIAVSLVMTNPMPLLAIPLMALVGDIYHTSNHPKKAEWYTGAYIGLIEALIIITA